VKFTVDTNVLIRVFVDDDQKQAQAARKLLKSAELIAVTSSSLCEFVWVLRQAYKFSRQDVAAAIRLLLDIRNVAMNRSAVEAGLAILESGGDFADGVIAYEGNWLGGETFASFDKDAVALIMERNGEAKLIA
jgi:predicted nucleic-acid-binding protein